MIRYALANHVFVCVQDEHVVFLDVRRDRYFTLRAEQTRSLASFVRGWPVTHAANTKTANSAEEASVSAALTPLLERGLLTGAEQDGKDATPIQLETPVTELTLEAFEGMPRVDALMLFRFLRAASGASLALRFHRFDDLIHKAREQRRTWEARKRVAPIDHTRTHELVAAFAWLRPFFYTAKNACLFEGLALRKFLASYSIHPRWVFGVQTGPFGAHCWLQQDGVVFNDAVEYVNRFTPIMVV
jgi:transglutaminase superfamily protein